MADKYITFTEDYDFRWPGVPKVTVYKKGRTMAVSPMVADAAIKAGKARKLPSRKPTPKEPEHETVGSKAEFDLASHQATKGDSGDAE